MSGSVNKVILIGNLGRDPEIRSMPSGGKIASFSLATSETWKDKMSGERKEKTEWHRVAVFNDGLVKVVENYVRKGSKLYIEGQLETRKWTDKDGAEKYSTEVVLRPYRGEIVLLGDKGGGGDAGDDGEARQAQAKGRPPADDDFGDEIPF